jgi:hypothetical protein
MLMRTKMKMIEVIAMQMQMVELIEINPIEMLAE